MEWRAIPGISKYEVSERGDVRLIGGKVNRKLCVGSHGYLVVNLRDDNGVERVRTVHRIVARAWHGEPPPGKDWAAHLDDNKLNPHRDNIEWQTPKRNMQDAFDRGLSPRGEKHGNARLSDRQVHEIRAAVANGELHRVVAERYGCSRSIVTRIVNRKTRAKDAHHENRDQEQVPSLHQL